MTLQTRLERPYRVRFDEAGPDGRLRTSGFLRYASDVAWQHSESAGFSRRWYAERQLTWLIRAVELDIVGEALYGSELTVTTEVVGFRRVAARRRSEFTVAGEERPLCVAITDWVLLNERGALTRVPPEIADAFPSASGEFTPIRVTRRSPPADAAEREFTVRRSDLDPLAHVNNAIYLDYLDEQFVGADRARAALPVPRRYRAEFVASAESGARLDGRGWQDGLGWAYRLDDENGDELFRAQLESDMASWVGG